MRADASYTIAEQVRQLDLARRAGCGRGLINGKGRFCGVY